MVKILFVDNHLLVVDKPAGVATQPSPTSSESLELLCKNWVKERFQKPGNVFLHALHRLDKPVSGIVLFARTSKALERLNEAMRKKQMQKTYLATLEGKLHPLQGTLEHYLVHGDHMAHLATATTPGAKLAVLRYSVKEYQGNFSVVEISLETGRYHQIRAQMAAVGHPVVGDAKYGGDTAYPKGAIALRHACFSFPHPISQALLTFNLM